MRLIFPRLACALAALLLLGGCQSGPRWLTEKDAAPLYDDLGQARSLSLSTSPILAAAYKQHGAQPWYIDRRDRGPSVIVGYESARYETSITYTRDRQYSSHGRSYDRYDEATYRRTYRESSR